jgi:hypothetical protein
MQIMVLLPCLIEALETNRAAHGKQTPSQLGQVSAPLTATTCLDCRWPCKRDTEADGEHLAMILPLPNVSLLLLAAETSKKQKFAFYVFLHTMQERCHDCNRVKKTLK